MITTVTIILLYFSISNIVDNNERLRTVTIFTNNGFVEVSTEQTLVKDILIEAQLSIDETHMVYPDLDEEVIGAFIYIKSGSLVNLFVDGEDVELLTWADTVEDLLLEQDIELAVDDIVNIPLNAMIESGQAIRVIRVKRVLVKEEVVLPTRNSYVDDPSLSPGTQKIIRTGRDGLKEITYEVVYEDGVEISKDVISEEIKIEPIIGIINRNTRALNVSRSARETVAPQPQAPTQQPIESKPQGYTNLGIASFYGGKFHGRLTASGEVFDKNAMTAAHRTLPFGTMVEVTYVKTGKSVIVRINDRGPFTPGRIIDLSEAAANKIGLHSDGIGEVRVREIK